MAQPDGDLANSADKKTRERMAEVGRVRAAIKATEDTLTEAIKANLVEANTDSAIASQYLEFLGDLYGEMLVDDESHEGGLLPISAWPAFPEDLRAEVVECLQGIKSGLAKRSGVARANRVLATLVENHLGYLAYPGTNFPSELNQRLHDLLEQGRKLQALITLQVQAEEAARYANEARVSAKHASEAAGETGATELGAHYNTLTESEAATANRWRWVTFGTLILLLVTTIYLLLIDFQEAITLADVARKATVSLVFIAMAGYSAKESANHRRVAIWAQTISVQLRTLGAYTEALPSDSRETIWREFGLMLFGQEAAGGHHPQTGRRAAKRLDNDGGS